MKPIQAHDQVRLAPGRCMVMTLRGITYRLFRSMVTVSILTLAVAFLVHILTYGLIQRSTTRYAWQGLREARLLGEWVTRLTRPDAPATIVSYFAEPANAGQPRLAEYQQWGNLDGARLEHTRTAAGQLRELWTDFQAFPVATRVVLMGGEEPEDAVRFARQLGRPEELTLFSKKLSELGIAAPLGGVEQTKHFIEKDYPLLEQTLEQIREGHRSVLAALQPLMPDGGAAVWLASDPAVVGPALRQQGFVTDDASLKQLSSLAGAGLKLENLRGLVRQPSVSSELAGVMGVRPVDVDLASVLGWLKANPDRMEWVCGLIARGFPDKAIDAAAISDLVDAAASQERFQKATGGNAPPEGDGLLAFSPDMKWLIIVSFLVCVVGVSNAMLMSVTERVSEIATMKCLGAMNGFVMQIFFFEALMQGVLGGLIGIALGVVLALVRGWSEFENLIFASMPISQIAVAALLAWATGLLLAAGAAIGPVWVAARLAPMEAMRVE